MPRYRDDDDFESTAQRVVSSLSGKAKYGVAIGLLGLVVLGVSGSLVEEVMPDQLVVIQAPISGKLTWYTSPGWAWQGMGTVTPYKRVYTSNFPISVNEKGAINGGISIRFSDGGHATMDGTVAFEMPTDETRLNHIHANFRGSDSVQSLIKTVVDKSVYLSGPLMTSKESYAEKRNDLIHYVTDQMQNGIYRTRQKREWVKDETGQSKEIIMAEIILGKNGQPERQEGSVLNQYGIKAFNFTIRQMPYDNAIEKQITQQQQLAMDVQTKIAEAKKAEQDALTAEANGRANAARVKWEQEAVKAGAVVQAQREKEVFETNAQRDKNVAETAAQQRLQVATLDRQSAEQYKQEQILKGEGESEYKRLVLQADGALAQKLQTWLEGQKVWANAMANSKVSLVPSIVMSGTGQVGAPGGTNAVETFMNLQNMKAMKDLSLDMSVPAGGTVTPQRR